MCLVLKGQIGKFQGNGILENIFSNSFQDVPLRGMFSKADS